MRATVESPAVRAIREQWSGTTTVAAVVSVIVLALMVILPLMLVEGSRNAPQHVSQALDALNVHRLKGENGVRARLRDAIDDSDELAAAKQHARDALSALNDGSLTVAKSRIVEGAATEDFSNALEALKDHDLKGSDGARHYLKKASELPGFASIADEATAAINAGKLKVAKADIKQGLATID